jgi:alpha-beta hydrolase superfamily lysophospholipase
MAGDAVPPRPDALQVRGGLRPETLFGRDDAGVGLELATAVTQDRHTWDALLYRPRRGPRRRRAVAVLVVHGAMGNYLAGVPRRVSFELARSGFTVLSANTRMANFGVVYGGGLLDRAPLDVDAALGLLRERGFERIVLLGYRLGAVLVTHYQAVRAPADVAGVCGLALPLSMPLAVRRRWDRLGAAPGYEEVARRARAAAAGEAEDRIFVVRHGSGASDAPVDQEVWTHRTWWSCCGPQAGHAVAADWIGRIDVPVALIQAERDGPAIDSDGEALAARARAGRCPDVRLEVLAGADHTLWGRVPEAAGHAVRWLDGAVVAGGPPAPPRARRRRGPARRLVTLTAADGSGHDALLYEDRRATRERERRTGRRTAVLHVHGNQGNLTVGALRFLPEPIARAGVPALVVETRLSNVSQLFGGALFEEALADLDAAVAWLAGRGADGLVVSGYSLGAVLAVRYAAQAGPGLRGLIGLGTAWSLPQSTERRMAETGAEPPYAEAARRARPGHGPADPDDLLVIEGAYGPTAAPRHAGVYTHRTWWHTRGPRATDAMAHLHIHDVGAPVLLVQGTADAVVDPADADRLAERARAAGNRSVTVAAIEGVGHSFAGGERRVVDAVLGWLRETDRAASDVPARGGG